jgi:hypothetical protein
MDAGCAAGWDLHDNPIFPLFPIAEREGKTCNIKAPRRN